MRAIPNDNLGLSMSVALGYWLGIPVFPSSFGGMRCACGQILDRFGGHLLGCRHNNLSIRQHNALSELFFMLSRLTILTVEENNVAEVTVLQGQVMFFTLTLIKDTLHTSEFSVRNSLQPLYIVQAAQHAGAAVEAGE